jgi:hypothetical protein
MKIYVVIHTVNQTMSPTVETSYHLNLEDAKKEFESRVRSVYDDYYTIYLEEFDTETKKVEFIDSFEGTDEDVEEEEEFDDE